MGKDFKEELPCCMTFPGRTPTTKSDLLRNVSEKKILGILYRRVHRWDCKHTWL